MRGPAFVVARLLCGRATSVPPGACPFAGMVLIAMDMRTHDGCLDSNPKDREADVQFELVRSGATTLAVTPPNLQILRPWIHVLLSTFYACFRNGLLLALHPDTRV